MKVFKRSFVTYLKRNSPSMQLASYGNGWIELPNGQRWNPGHTYKFNTSTSSRPLWRRLLEVVRGQRYGH